LRERPHTTGELCAHFDFSRFAVMKHLKVLEAASLIFVERRGRERHNHINPVPIQQIYRRWIRPFEALPADRLLRIKRLAEASAEPRKEQKSE
jgi:DNA-binding transcriptional ArsR family regulator